MILNGTHFKIQIKTTAMIHSKQNSIHLLCYLYTCLSLLVGWQTYAGEGDANNTYEKQVLTQSNTDLETNQSNAIVRTWQINFSDNWIANSDWTKVTLPASTYSNLIDDAQNVTTINLIVNETWNSGAVIGHHDDNPYPDGVANTCLYSPTTVTMTFTGLNVINEYDFTFFCSSAYISDKPTAYEINGQSVSLVSEGNVDQTVQLTGIIPDANGEITVICKEGAPSSGILLGAIVLDEHEATQNAPEADAGSDQTLAAESTTTTLTGTGSGVGTLSYSWTQLEGPSTANISSSGSASTPVSNLIEGAYTFELTVSDDNGADKDTVVVRVETSSGSGDPSGSLCETIICNETQVGIGVSQEELAVWQDYNLLVDGKIGAKKIMINAEGLWPDYVFDENYALKSLEAIERYIETNHHLPGLPQASEVEANGIDVSSLVTKQMEKIEELTLLMIEMNKQLKAQQSQLEALEETNRQLRGEQNPSTEQE